MFLKLLLLLILLFSALCLKVLRSQWYWQKMGVPTPRSTFLLGNHMFFSLSTLLRRKHTSQVAKEQYFEMYNQPFYGTYALSSPSLVVCDPEMVKRVLVKDFGHFGDRNGFFLRRDLLTSELGDQIFKRQLLMLEGAEWKDNRATLTSCFNARRLRGVVQISHTIAKRLVSQLDGYSQGGEAVDMGDICRRLAMDVVALSAVGIDAETLTNRESLFAKYGRSLTSLSFIDLVKFIVVSVPGGLSLCNWLHISIFKSREMAFFQRVTKSSMEYRRDTGMRVNDFLDLFIDAVEDESKCFDEINLLGSSLLMLIGGSETTGATMANACYELAMNPGIQKRLQEEIDAVEGDLLEYEQRNNINLLEKFIMETLRLHPALSSLGRNCTEEYRLPGTDKVISKGTKIRVNVIGIHMDPKYYPNPEKFDPENFSVENKSKRHPYTFLGFGSGPRTCLGMRMAMIEMKVFLVAILKHFNLIRTDHSIKKKVCDPAMFFSYIKGGVWLKIERRR